MVRCMMRSILANSVKLSRSTRCFHSFSIWRFFPRVFRCERSMDAGMLLSMLWHRTGVRAILLSREWWMRMQYCGGRPETLAPWQVRCTAYPGRATGTCCLAPTARTNLIEPRLN